MPDASPMADTVSAESYRLDVEPLASRKPPRRLLREKVFVKRKRTARGRFPLEYSRVTVSGQAGVFFAKGAHPEARLWFRTPEGSTAPYVPTRRRA